MKQYKKRKNIFRIDTANGTHGWQVRVQRQGTQHTKFFADRDGEDGRARALGASETYRDQLIEELPEPTLEMDDLPDDVRFARAGNWTGVIGIGLTMQGRQGGTYYPFVQGCWEDEDGTPHAMKRSVRKHGLKSALWQICTRLHEAKTANGEDPMTPEDMFKTAYPALEERVPDEEPA